MVADAVISPSGCGNIYMNATPRVIYGWARTGTFFKVFTRIDEIRHPAPGVVAYLRPVDLLDPAVPFTGGADQRGIGSPGAELRGRSGLGRRLAPQRTRHERPFRVKAMSVLGPVSFIIASLIVYWSGWSTVSWLLSLQILMFVVYLLAGRFVPTEHLSLKQQVHSSLWLVGFYAMIIVFSKLGSFGGIGVLAHPLDNVVVGLCSWASTTGAHAPVCQHTCCVWMPMKRGRTTERPAKRQRIHHRPRTLSRRSTPPRLAFSRTHRGSLGLPRSHIE